MKKKCTPIELCGKLNKYAQEYPYSNASNMDDLRAYQLDLSLLIAEVCSGRPISAIDLEKVLDDLYYHLNRFPENRFLLIGRTDKLIQGILHKMSLPELCGKPRVQGHSLTMLWFLTTDRDGYHIDEDIVWDWKEQHVQIVVNAMNNHPKDLQVQCVALRLLCTLSTTGKNRDHILKHDAIGAILNATKYHHASDELALLCHSFLGNMTRDMDSKEARPMESKEAMKIYAWVVECLLRTDDDP